VTRRLSQINESDLKKVLQDQKSATKLNPDAAEFEPSFTPSAPRRQYQQQPYYAQQQAYYEYDPNMYGYYPPQAYYGYPPYGGYYDPSYPVDQQPPNPSQPQ
jgi:hypothetical protein